MRKIEQELADCAAGRLYQYSRRKEMAGSQNYDERVHMGSTMEAPGTNSARLLKIFVQLLSAHLCYELPAHSHINHEAVLVCPAGHSSILLL